MSTSREPLRWSEDELLDWLLDARARRRIARSRIEARPGTAARLAELEELLASCKRGGARFDEVGPARHRALVERALARTTRARAAWGRSAPSPQRLCARLALPPWLRVAAATLLAASIAWPVAAWYRSTTTAPAVVREGSAPAPAVDASIASADPLGLELAVREWDPERFVATSLRWARFRSGGGTSLFQRALECELLLDREAAQPSSSAQLEEALAALAKDPLPADDAGLLAAAALARAESLGVLPASATGALSRARRDLGRTPGAEALIEPAASVRRIASLDGAWRAALVAAAPGPVSSELVHALEGWEPR